MMEKKGLEKIDCYKLKEKLGLDVKIVFYESNSVVY